MGGPRVLAMLLVLLGAAEFMQPAAGASCNNGVDGFLSQSGTACCPKSCTTCSSKTCKDVKAGTGGSCCEPQIVKTAKLCGTTSKAPCRIQRHFNIKLIWAGIDPKYRPYFEQARKRWEKVITGDVFDWPVSFAPTNGWFDGELGKTSEYRGFVDDIVIGCRVKYIDGKSNVLARSGPLYVRNDAPGLPSAEQGLPLSGIMDFDSADVKDLVARGMFQSVVEHEMAHVLGFGSAWPTERAKCGGKCTSYSDGSTGTCYATNKFRQLGMGSQLLLETGGAEGTACSHWSEAQLGNELMTGYMDNTNPLSAITIGAMQDLGYKVDYSQADRFTPSQPTTVRASSLPRTYDLHGYVVTRPHKKPANI